MEVVLARPTGSDDLPEIWRPHSNCGNALMASNPRTCTYSWQVMFSTFHPSEACKVAERFSERTYPHDFSVRPHSDRRNPPAKPGYYVSAYSLARHAGAHSDAT